MRNELAKAVTKCQFYFKIRWTMFKTFMGAAYTQRCRQQRHPGPWCLGYAMCLVVTYRIVDFFGNFRTYIFVELNSWEGVALICKVMTVQ